MPVNAGDECASSAAFALNSVQRRLPRGVDMVAIFENVSAVSTEYTEIARRPLEADQCALVVVDIQEKLLPPIFQKEQLVRNSSC
jgi:hypothetical protein